MSSMTIAILLSLSSFFSDLSKRRLNKFEKNSSEYWYIGSIAAKSAITKYKIEPLHATGLKDSLSSVMIMLVFSASVTRSLMLVEVILDYSNTLINSSSARMSSEASETNFRILSSNS